MLTGKLRNQVDKIWEAFWTGGITNSISVIEQFSYLLFIRRLDDLHTLEENRANRLRQPMERRIFPEGKEEQNVLAQQRYSPMARVVSGSWAV